MKNKIKLLLLLFLMIPIIVLAESQMKGYFDATSEANNYINKYLDRNKYLLLNNVKFKYEDRTLSVDPVFTKGGFLNKSEFDLSIINGKSYLASGREYWTMTSVSAGVNYYVDAYILSKSTTNSSGVRVTEQVKGSTKITGKGTYSNPWVFEEGYEVTVKPNNSSYATLTPMTQTVKRGGTATITANVKTGYEYTGKDDCNLVRKDATTYEIQNVTKDISCIAIFEQKTYKMNLTSSKAYTTYPSPSTIYYKEGTGWFNNNTSGGVKITKITPPTITGYTFNGYKYGSTQVISASGNILMNTIPSFSYGSDEQNLVADITANTYTVSYNTNGGSSCPSVTVTFDSNYGTLCTPVKTGYTFSGWYKESALTNKVEASTTVSTASNHTLYAKWTAITYQVKYNANGGSGTMSNSTHTYGTAKALTTNAFTRTGYKFAGWATTSDGSVEYSDGQSVSNLTTTANATVNLYAKWTINKVYVRYNMNGGTWGGTTNTHLGVSGSWITYDGNSTTAFAKNYDGTINLNNWNNADYINITKAGYVAKSGAQWCITTNGTGTCFDHAADYTNVGTDATVATHFCDARTSDCTVKLYVNWVQKPIRIYYNRNGGTVNSETYTTNGNWISKDGSTSFYQTLSEGESKDPFNYTTFGLSKSGYVVPDGTEWCTKSDGTGTCYDHDVTYSYDTLKSAATEKAAYYELDLYVHWTPGTYTVKFNNNGGSGTMSNITCQVGSNCTLPDNEFTKSNNSFVIWSTSSGTTAIINDAGTYSGECTSGSYKDFKEYVHIVQPSINQKYGLDCDVKGNGRMENYFYGSNQASYLQVASFSTSQGKSGTAKDGHNVIDTTSSYQHYHADFVMGSSPSTTENKNLLFRVLVNYNGSVKNIKFYRKAGSESTYVNKATVKNLTSAGGTVTLYAIWKYTGGGDIGEQGDPIGGGGTQDCCPSGGYHYNGYCYTNSIGNTGQGTCGSQGYDYYNGQCYTSRYQDSC